MSRQDALQRLKSARGHLDAVIRMTEERRYCTEVLYQIRAVERSLELTKRAILDEHLNVCVRDPERGIDTDEHVGELLGSLFGGRPPTGSNFYVVTGDAELATRVSSG
jgi:DNA-binding FrmR family transcriptional regulator